MECPNCKSQIKYACTECGHTQPVVESGPRDLREIVESFLQSGDTAELNSLFDAYEPLLTLEADPGVRLSEWSKLKSDIRGLAIAIRNRRTIE